MATDVLRRVSAREHDKYTEMWSVDHYAKHSPGLEAIPRFRRITLAAPRERVADFGCGDGRAAQRLAQDGFIVTGYDLTDVRRPENRDFHFHQQALWHSIPQTWHRWGYCVDVLEHIPAEFTMLAIWQMVRACGRLYAEIALTPDSCGVWIGQTLHETVRPFVWWRDRLREVGHVKEARDRLHHGVFVVTA